MLAELEDLILQKIFLVSLDPRDNSTGIVYLEMMATKIVREDKMLKLSQELMEGVVIDRLSGSFPAAEPPSQYLVNCYHRAYEEEKKIASVKDEKVRLEMELVIKKAKKLIALYCRMHLTNPDMFLSNPDNQSSVCLIFAEAAPGFTEDFFAEAVYDSIEHFLHKLYDHLKGSVSRVSALGNFQQPLKALMALVNHPVGAKALVSHPWWLPQCNGRLIEMTSLLGPFFHVSALPDHDIFKSNPDIEKCFRPTCSPDDVLLSFSNIKKCMILLYDSLSNVLMCLLKSTNTREYVLEYLADVVNKNASSEHFQFSPTTSASVGMFVNLSAVMLRLCQQFFDADMTKIDAKYVMYSNHLKLRGFTALRASESEVSKLFECNSAIVDASTNTGSTSTSEETEYTLRCECFFMTARVLKLGLLQAFSHFQLFCQHISRCEDSLKEQENSEFIIASLKEELELYTKSKLCYEAQILKDEGIFQLASTYYHQMVVWLVGLVGGFKMPLSPTCPKEFACMPEHFVEDTMDFLIFASQVPIDLHGIMLDDFMNFIVMFMSSPEFIRNPHLRIKMVEVLRCWMSLRSGSKAIDTLFEGHQLAVEYLVMSLLKIYAHVETTDSGIQVIVTKFDDKFSSRCNIAKLLQHLWNFPNHQNAWRKITTEENSVHLIFLNFLINDTIWLVDQSLTTVLELNKLKAKMSATVEWESTPEEERDENTQYFHFQEHFLEVCMKWANEELNMLVFTSEQITVPFLLPEMVGRVAVMLNYFLLELVEKQTLYLCLEDFEKYGFRPKELLKQIVTIYLNLARGDKDNIFPAAIIRDGLSRDKQLFDRASNVLRNYEEDARIIQEFNELGTKAKVADSEASQAEKALGDIPDEFIDQIECTLMKDPVRLPSSRINLDRQVIERHILNNNSDPFDRSPLTVDMLIPNDELKRRIEEFVRSRTEG